MVAVYPRYESFYSGQIVDYAHNDYLATREVAREDLPPSQNLRTLKKEDFTNPTKSRASFLPRLAGPAQLHTDADLHRGAGKDRIPFRHFVILLPFQNDGLRPAEYGQRRTSTPILKMLHQNSHRILHH